MARTQRMPESNRAYQIYIAYHIGINERNIYLWRRAEPLPRRGENRSVWNVLIQWRSWTTQPEISIQLDDLLDSTTTCFLTRGFRCFYFKTSWEPFCSSNPILLLLQRLPRGAERNFVAWRTTSSCVELKNAGGPENGIAIELN